MEHVIVEGRYLEPTTPEAIQKRGLGQRFCFDLYRSHPVTHYLSLDGAHILCVFRAPDAEAVRRSLNAIGVLPPDRVWTASLEGPFTDPPALAAEAIAAELRAAQEALPPPSQVTYAPDCLNPANALPMGRRRPGANLGVFKGMVSEMFRN
ncbi:hypothetical protein IQ216_05295 [Cyanobium sp. LEGE 06143]|uniref:hypothetical protein n=1 Tax=Cyanobium sp. LEGE 06143 TaxID=945727 RepID=UPI0018808761|nr:hypothetical protein [Cyanobium sp. LEGE 06143]MBE9172519.1 hypothetical protein [Cyanobium sp. LEGE 06143]